MQFVQTIFEILLMLFGFGMLIFVHELGHFLAAKWAGIRTEGFAIGMGPHVFSWRKGTGFCLGSSERQREKRVAAYISEHPESFGEKTVAQLSNEQYSRASDAMNLGETEYSLRWLPIGGFVKMLGQDDSDPTATSSDPRSYNMRPIGKRMVVVSAGVIMNIIFAAILFLVAFMVGVQFPAPIIGDISETMPAGRAIAVNATELGLVGSDAKLRAGDEITHIDGEDIETFADVELASAFSKVDEVLELRVHREGVPEPLVFNVSPELNPVTGLRSIGLMRGASTTLHSKPVDQVREALVQLGLAESGIEPGMRLLTVNGQPVTAFDELAQIVRLGDGSPVRTEWTALDDAGEPTGSMIELKLQPEPTYMRQQAIRSGVASQAIDNGLFGLTPCVKVAGVESNSPNFDTLRNGDVFVRIARNDYPTYSEFLAAITDHTGDALPAVVLRDGEEVPVELTVNRKGKILVMVGSALDVPRIAQPIEVVNGADRLDPAEVTGPETVERTTPVAGKQILGGSVLRAVNGISFEDWGGFRAALREATADAAASADVSGTTVVALTYTTPMVPPDDVTVEIELSAADVRALHDLQWTTTFASTLFEDLYITRSAGGNPIRALTMGVEETHSMILMTYMTIDRLFRRTVGIEQLHGPVGIIHLGTRIMDRGLMYLIFFLAAISVNLAVINFLPLPIVDGGLFLFLIYEKIKGRPPTPAFQNAAMFVGLALIGSLFIITFYNDVMRIFAG